MAITFLFSLFFTLALAQTDHEKYTYFEFDAQMEMWGYTWESHNVLTEDGWHLVLFHITGNQDGPFEFDNSNGGVGNFPILFQHEEFSDAETFLRKSEIARPWILDLSAAGYDVWLANSRGTKYSFMSADQEKDEAEMWTFT